MGTTIKNETEPVVIHSLPNRVPWYRDIAIWLGAAGIFCFSLTLPFTHLAVPAFGSVIVGLGRAVVAAILAGILLLVRREPLPNRRNWPGLILVALGVVFGFPLFSALALQGTSVAH